MTLAELQKLVREHVTGSNHYVGCEAVHGWCAAAKAFAELERVREELLDARLHAARSSVTSASLRLKMPGVRR